MRKKLPVAIVAAALAILTARCGYAHKNFSYAKTPLSTGVSHAVQIDDLGQFWDRDAALRVLDDVTASARRTNTIVVLFVHGWHHNAHPKDSNAEDFGRTLELLRTTLQEPAYRSSREKLTRDGNVNVIGIYIGWRGRSLPGPLDYLTFWTRKEAAERVGRGDVSEFLARLQHIYEERNAPDPATEQRPFMGLVGIGHSFGGQVFFQAVAPTLEQELIKATAQTTDGRPAGPVRLSGFGDLVVLVNPALEALQYQRIDMLSRELQYAPSQAPVLLVLSAATDSARRVFFPLGRHLDAITRPAMRGNQKELWTKALGEYEPQRTHTIEVRKKEEMTSAAFDPSWYVDRPCAIVNFDLSNVPAVARVRLQPTGTHHPFNPFLVARADAEVVIEHSGIFEPVLREFLSEYIAVAQGKRILARRQSSARCAAAASGM